MGQSKKYWIRKGGITKELALVDSNQQPEGYCWTPDLQNAKTFLTQEAAEQYAKQINLKNYGVFEMPDEPVMACKASGTHLKSCDNDGFCNLCGYQDDTRGYKDD